MGGASPWMRGRLQSVRRVGRKHEHRGEAPRRMNRSDQIDGNGTIAVVARFRRTNAAATSRWSAWSYAYVRVLSVAPMRCHALVLSGTTASPRSDGPIVLPRVVIRPTGCRRSRNDLYGAADERRTLGSSLAPFIATPGRPDRRSHRGGYPKPGVSCRVIVAFSHAPTAGGIWPRASRRQHPARSIPIWLLQVSVSASHACTTRSGQPPAHTTFDDAYPSAGSMSLGGM